MSDMEYVRFGNTGLTVSRLCLGCMSYGNPKWAEWVIPEEPSLEMIKYAWDKGINFWDTANMYSNGDSERIVGNALRKFNIPRERVVIASKVYFPTFPEAMNRRAGGKMPGRDDQFRAGLSRKSIFFEVEQSLKRLGTDYIDLYQIHRFDNDTPIEETMLALHDLVRAGKVRYLGASSMRAWQLSKMQYTAKMNGWTPFVSMQNLVNAVYREEEREMVPLLQDWGMACIPWSPLARGALTGKNRETVRTKSDPMYRVMNKGEGADGAVIDRIYDVAEKKGVTVPQVALAWLYSKPYITSPIVGVSKKHHLDDLIGGLKVKLTPDEIAAIEEPYVPKKVQGHL
ncbi:aldo/keto reductase [Hyaloraphidium curvatum]|nr:aldo/keto reductase [Hyaloraphidium curvatum]